MTPRRLALAAVICLAATACSPVVTARGNLVEADRVAQIQTGTSTRDDVLSLFGSPSAVGTLDDSTWYYVGQVTEQTAFFDPEVVERRVVVVKFDANGVVTEVQELDAADGRDIAIVTDETPTGGNDFTLLQQLLGNLGRFNPKPN